MKYGQISSDVKDFHDGEPLFLVRATDPLAIATVIQYAKLARAAGCNPDFLEQLDAHMGRIAYWQNTHSELVKERPD